MTLRNYLIGMIASVILCFVAWISILLNVNPFETNWRGFSLFYLSLFFTLVSFFTLLAFFIRCKISKHPAFSLVGVSFRQGILFSVVLTGALALQGFKMLNWWNGVLLLFIVLVVEFYFIRQEEGV